MFNEKTKERFNGQDLPVMQMPKYKEGREAAVKLIKEKDYITEGDFWILMNKTKAGDKMLYSGLIISHNGCLKINDNAEQKFKPECVTVNESGYGGALVYTYNCAEQGIYEVGEVSAKNCKNDYPYAMALKRCFDRVVLKLCKLAFYGIYSDSEADEFKEPDKGTEKAGAEPPKKPTADEKKQQRQAEEQKAAAANQGFQQVMDAVPMATKEQISKIKEACKILGQEEGTILEAFRVKSFSEMTEVAAGNAIKRLNAKADEVA